PGPYVQDSLIVERSDYPGLERGELEIKFGGGKLSLFEAHEEWLKGGFYGPRIRTERSVQGETLQLGLRQESYRLPRLVRRMHSDWEIGLSPDLNWEIELDAGAVKGDLDLSALPVDNFDLNLGAGDLTFALGDKSESTKVAVKAGASNITMLVPENVGVSVAVNGALASTNLNNLGWQKVDGRYFSPDYEDAEAQIDLDLELAVGNFSIKVEAVR
ncbi:MAG: toast rack family protein, partial [Dethiobacteria bacterium]